MVDRQEVEKLLEYVEMRMSSDKVELPPSVSDGTLAALCRAWLAVEDARALLRDAAALEAAREDTARLDWLDKQRGDDVRWDPRTGDPELVAHYWAIQGQCDDVRTAIDDAREARND